MKFKGPSKDELKQKRIRELKYKTLLGWIVYLTGLGLIICLVCIKIYMVLIENNKCLFYQFDPPCDFGYILNTTVSEKDNTLFFYYCNLKKEDYGTACLLDPL